MDDSIICGPAGVTPLAERDHGTPASQSKASLKLKINGQTLAVPVGTSIMRAALSAGVRVPKLCATDRLRSFGSCRLCLVEIEGRPGYPASCTTLVEDGMQVRTQSTALDRLRRNVMELYISDHPLDCLTCATNGDCELQDMAGATGLREVRYTNGSNHFSTHSKAEKDSSNPYFVYDPAKCIVCSRCVRVCEEVQGSFALSIVGRGFASRVAAGQNESFMASECVSCGACVDICPTATLVEKSLVDQGQAQSSVVTTCAYCGVGCNFKAELRGNEVVRMIPWKGGRANEGHACVKGRFAWGYVNHRERITSPMIRASIDEAWQEASWEEAIAHTAAEFKRIQAKYGPASVGAIVSSRCTNEEDFLLQKLVRTAFGNNNVDTCARVCHSPTGYGLKQTLGESAGTQTFKSIEKSDVIMVIGANPSDGHPVFASRLKRRVREGARLIVIDPRAIDIVHAPHVRANIHLQLRPGTNVAALSAMAHVIVSENLFDQNFVAERCDEQSFVDWRAFAAREENSPEALAAECGISAEDIRKAARLYASADNAAIYYGLGVTEHSQGSTAVIAIANLAMVTGNLGREGVGVNPLRGQNNVQGSCDMGSFPHELPGYRHVSDQATRALFADAWGVDLLPTPGLRIPNMFEAALDGSFMGMLCQGEDPLQSDPNSQHVEAALAAMQCLVVQDLFLNETARYAHVFLPGASFLEKDGTFTNAERRISRVRKAMAPLSGKADWQITMELAQALGYAMHYEHPSEIMDEIASLTPTFSSVSYQRLDEEGSLQWPCNDAAPEGTPIMHVDQFVRGKGKFIITQYVATDEKVTRRFPLLLTTGRVLSQYNVGAQTRRTANVSFCDEDKLEIHPHDAEERGIDDGDRVRLASRVGETTMRSVVTSRVSPGVVYTTFHFPESGTNVLTTGNSDWATNCPEYKVTAVQVERLGTQ